MAKKPSFSQYLKQKREAACLSQKQVADRLGYTTPQFISNWERGLSTPPMKALKKIADLYQTPAEEMFDLLLQDTLQQVTVDFKKKMAKVL